MTMTEVKNLHTQKIIPNTHKDLKQSNFSYSFMDLDLFRITLDISISRIDYFNEFFMKHK